MFLWNLEEMKMGYTSKYPGGEFDSYMKDVKKNFSSPKPTKVKRYELESAYKKKK